MTTAKAPGRVGFAASSSDTSRIGMLGTVADYRDPEKVRALVARAKRSGLVGANCIHPALVPILIRARRILAQAG